MGDHDCVLNRGCMNFNGIAQDVSGLLYGFTGKLLSLKHSADVMFHMTYHHSYMSMYVIFIQALFSCSGSLSYITIRLSVLIHVTMTISQQLIS